MKTAGKYVLVGFVVFIAAVVAAINAGANGGQSQPSEVWVDDDFDNGTPGWGYDHFATIQDGIDAVAEGGIVHVADGTYEENIVINKALTLINSSKPVIDGQGEHAINITANSVSVIGFNITNASFGIYCNASGFVIKNNTFWYDDTGFYWNIEERPSEDYTIYDGIVEKNEFYMNQDYYAIFAYINLNYSKNGPYNVTIGNITIWGNTFYMNGSDAIGVHISEEIGDLCGGNISAGIVNISNNKIYGGMGGIDFSGDFYDLTDVNVSVDDVIINENIMLNQSLGGVSTDYYGASLWNGNTTGIYGDLIINGNKIYSSSNGIYIGLEYFGVDMHDNATATLGFINISNNMINSSKHGIYFYAGYLGHEMHDNASIGVGKFIIHNNNITANDNYDGIHICTEYWSHNMSHNSSCNIGNFKITKNNVSCKNGIYFEYFRYVGCNLSDDTSVVIGDLVINDNIIDATEDGIYVYPEYLGYYMEDNASFSTGIFSLNGNAVVSGGSFGYGILFCTYYWGSYMEDNSSFQMGLVEVKDNIIEDSYYGIGVWPYYVAYEIEDNATVVMDNWYVTRNNVTSDSYGINAGPYEIAYYMDDSASLMMGDFVITHNNVTSDDDGIYYYFYGVGTGLYGKIDGGNSVIVGESRIEGNILDTDSEGIYVYYGIAYDFYYDSYMIMDSLYINDNEIESAGDAIYLYFSWAAYDMYGNSLFLMNDIYMTDNFIDSSGYGISIYYPEEDVVYDIYDNAMVYLPDYIITGNTINADDDSIYFYMYENIYYVEDETRVYAGGFTIEDNTFISNNGVYLYYYDVCYSGYDSVTTFGDIDLTGNEFHVNNKAVWIDGEIGYDLYGNAQLNIGNITIYDNFMDCAYGVDVEYEISARDDSELTIGFINVEGNEIRNCTDDGIFIWYSSYASDSSTIFIGNIIVEKNTIDNCSKGIYVYCDIGNDIDAVAEIGRTHMSDNTISNCSYGIYLSEEWNHTDIIGNTIFDNTYGIYVWGGFEGSYENTDTEIHWNKIYDNSMYGLLYEIEAGGTPYINATYNFWGNGNGPSNDNMIDPVTGEWANGTGDAIGGGIVNDNIHFDPWIGKVKLYEGWNTICLPVWNESITTAEELGDYINIAAGDNVCVIISKWDASKQRYISHVVGFGGDGFTLKPGEGYFIYMTAEMNISFDGTIIEPEVNLTLYSGYNFIGWTKTIPTHIKNIGENLSQCTKAVWWHADRQEWDPGYSYIKKIGENKQIIVGETVFILKKTGEIWQG